MSQPVASQRKVVYHSDLWGSLVEQGFVTMTVDDVDGERIATMAPPRNATASGG